MESDGEHGKAWIHGAARLCEREEMVSAEEIARIRDTRDEWFGGAFMQENMC
jgi:hypothetical protein